MAYITSATGCVPVETPMPAAVYGGNGSARLSGNDLTDALSPLDALSEKISLLRCFIATAQVIDPEKRASDKVQMLSKVTVRIQGLSVPMTIRIVGANDTDPARREISCSSPVGKSLLGRKVCESVKLGSMAAPSDAISFPFSL